jgi:hypothetical protein
MNPAAQIETIATSIIGASESIDLILGSGFAPDFFVANADVFHVVDERISRRSLVFDPAGGAPYRSRIGDFAGILSGVGWEVRVIDRPPSLSCLIVDRERAFLSKFGDGYVQELKPPIELSDEPHLHALKSHFNMLWHALASEELLYEDLIASSIPETEHRVISTADGHWNYLISQLSKNPDEMYRMDPRSFEELVAQLLSREGFDVTLTPPTKDGGRDVLAVENTAAGQHLYLVECKRQARHRPVSVDIVRALYGVVEEEKATGGLLVTTSHFSSDAWKFRDGISYRMALRDYDTLVEWLARYAGKV